VSALITPLVTDIETLVADVQGFSPVDELYTLSMFVHATTGLPGDVVEIGSWHGRSSVVLGTAARETHGLVHCIDLFPRLEDWYKNPDGTYSFSVEMNGQRHSGYQEQTVWPDAFEARVAPIYAHCPDVFETFTANVRRASLTKVVRPHRGTSTTFAATQLPRFQARAIFIDGDHGYEAVKTDILNLWSFLVPGGWICFDDAFSGYDGVDRAVTELVIGNDDFDVKRQFTRKCFAARKAPLRARS
jgi:predicted O-methyltransferase YrrM